MSLQDSTPGPDVPTSAAQIIASLDHRLRSLENRLAELAADRGAAAAAIDPEPLAALSAAVAAQGDVMRDIEVKLVGRIADVDDDRRRTASGLQRALDTQREELAAGVRRTLRATGLFVLLVVSLAAAAVWWALNRTSSIESLSSESLAQIRQEIAELSADNADRELLRERLAGLSGAVSEISASIAELAERQDQTVQDSADAERRERLQADAGLSERLGLLERAEAGIAGELEALRAAMDAVILTASTGPQRQVPEAADTPAEPSPAAPQGADTPTESGPAAPQAADRPIESGPAAAQAADRPIESSPAASQAAEPEPPGSPDDRRAPSPETASAGQGAVGQGGVLKLEDPRLALQLIGFYSFDALRGFSEREDLRMPLYYRRETLRGRPWYVLIHSLHPDRAAAAAERSRLPADLAQLDIWIRRLPPGAELRLLEPAPGDGGILDQGLP